MYKAVITVVVAIIVASPTPSSADGLLYQLPEDGAWARFNIIDAKAKEADGTAVSLVGTVTLSSVGTTEVDGKRCRWIEIVTEARRNDEGFTDIDKLLIPEEHLKHGQQPLKHVLKLWHKHSQIPDGPKQIDLDERGARYLEKIRPFLHGPFQTEQKLDKTLVESKLGKLACEGITATEKVDHGGGASFSFTYTIRRHKKAPFGVVAWEAQANLERNGQAAGSMITKLTLCDFGKDAKSALPESK